MTSDAKRLTLSEAVPGARVVCVDHIGDVLREGMTFIVSGAYNGYNDPYVTLREISGGWRLEHFTLAPPPAAEAPSVRDYLAQHAPGLLAALMEWHARVSWEKEFYPRTLAAVTERLFAVLPTIPALIPAAPAPVSLPAMWCGAEAFEGEGA